MGRPADARPRFPMRCSQLLVTFPAVLRFHSNPRAWVRGLSPKKGDRMKSLSFVLPLLLALAVRTAQCAEPGSQTVASEDSLGARLVAEGNRMIDSFQQTRYSHKTHIDVAQGICEVDCSGFIDAILKKVAPTNLQAIATDHKRPLAEDYYDAIAGRNGERAPGWKRIIHVRFVRAGDVLAWLKLDRKPGDNTGHVMLIAEKPVLERPGQYRVRILDSTMSPHARDNRAEGQTGIGRGTIWIDVDSKDRPIGYHWKLHNGKLHKAPIAIGRILPIDR